MGTSEVAVTSEVVVTSEVAVTSEAVGISEAVAVVVHPGVRAVRGVTTMARVLAGGEEDMRVRSWRYFGVGADGTC